MGIPFAVIAQNVNYAESLSTDAIVSHETTLDRMEKGGKYAIHVAGTLLDTFY